MDSIKQDTELAAELIPLLGRELKVARKRIQELENQVGLQQDSHMSISGSERATTEAANIALKDNIARLEAENLRLRRDLDGPEEIKSGVRLFDSSRQHDGDQLSQLSEELNRRELTAHQHVTQVATLEGELTTLREHFTRQKEATDKLQQTCDELGTQLKDLADEKDLLTQTLNALREVPLPQADDPPDASITDEGDPAPVEGGVEGKTFKELADYEAFMAALPDIFTRPKIAQLKPLYRKTVNQCHDDDIAELTRFCSGDQNLDSEWLSSGILFFPGRTIWCPISRQHALVLGSHHQYNVQEQCWAQMSDLNLFKKPTHELFYTNGKFVYYAGTYKCHQLQELTPGAVTTLDPAILNTVINAAVRTGKKHKIHRPTITKLYCDGVLKVECIGLQCVGFNFGIYNALLERADLDAGNKRKVSGDDNGQSTKRKTSKTSSEVVMNDFEYF